MRNIEVIRPWSFKTRNGRWSLEPGVPRWVPEIVAMAAESDLVLLRDERRGHRLSEGERAGRGDTPTQRHRKRSHVYRGKPATKTPRASAPWWWPDQRGAALIGLFALTACILWVSRPAVGGEPSEFFKAIAQAVVLTGFLTAIGFLFQASKGASEASAPLNTPLDDVTLTTSDHAP
jgi:hypothetical protein